MNFLVLTDDGPESIGFRILLEAVRKNWPKTKVVGITTQQPTPGVSFGVTVRKDGTPGEPHVGISSTVSTILDTPIYTVHGTIVDALYVAILYPDRVIGVGPTFDAVLTGVNQGHNVGMDVLHSGTVAAAALAASAFGLPSMAFSQQIAALPSAELKDVHNNRKDFQIAEKFVEVMLREASFSPGTCINVNFPKVQPKGYKRAAVAPYSRWLPAFKMPREQNDITALEEGFIAVSDIELSIQPTTR